MAFVANYREQIYALLRVVTGFLFVWHGTSKVLGFPDAPPPGTPAFIIYGAGLIELLGGGLIAVGLATRFVAFICSGLMAVAYFMAHAGQAFLPYSNGGELAVLYCFLFLYMSARGAGIWSIDHVRLQHASD